MKDLKQFIGIYPVSKTLRFELKPIGKTQEWIEKNHVLEHDWKRTEDYPKVKEMIDAYHKLCIGKSLKNMDFDWVPLRDAIERNRQEKSDESKKALEAEQTKMRNKIHDQLSKFEHYKKLNADTPSLLINHILPQEDALESFKKFATYFEGFQKNRKNIYSKEAISTGVPYRLVHDNFPKFLANIEVFENLQELCPEVIQQAATEMAPFLQGVMIEDVFTVGFYNTILTQDGIDFYNQILGGVVKDERHYQGINQLTNLYRQAHPDLTANRRSMTMVPLFKQILSDRETLSDISKPIESEEQLIKTVTSFYRRITDFTLNGNCVNIISELAALAQSLNTYNPEGIFISAKSLTDVSHTLYGHWNKLNEKLYEKAVEAIGDVQVAKNKKKVEAYLNNRTEFWRRCFHRSILRKHLWCR